MERSHQLGIFIMIGASVSMLIMLIGLIRRSYLVIALPVVAGVEQNAAAAILDEGGEAPVELETGAVAERVVEDRHSARRERGGAGCR